MLKSNSDIKKCMVFTDLSNDDLFHIPCVNKSNGFILLGVSAKCFQTSKEAENGTRL